MSNILTPEEKKLLKRTCSYLGSLGMREGFIELEIEYSNFDCNDVNWNDITVFANNYTAEIPNEIITVFKKILEYVCENDLISTPDIDDINYERLTIEIDCDEKAVSVTHDYSYYDTGDTEQITRSLEDDSDDESLIEVFDVLESDDSITDRVLQLDYNGSGDSGYLEDSFTNGDSVPAEVEDYCYRLLENNFGGWEINEGSQGNFEIDLDRKEITLNHTMNIDESERDTLWEEKF